MSDEVKINCASTYGEKVGGCQYTIPDMKDALRVFEDMEISDDDLDQPDFEITAFEDFSVHTF